MLIMIRPLYKVRMRQDQARTRVHDTKGRRKRGNIAAETF